MIDVHRVLKEIETIDRDDLLVWDAIESKGHEKKVMKVGEGCQVT